MKFTYNWLKDFVDIKIAPQALADKLTMAGLEVEDVQAHDGDTVFGVEITSNRPDWLSVIGIAREAAAITGAKLKKPNRVNSRLPIVHRPSAMDYRPITIKIENKLDCPLYTAKIISGIKVGPSPEWLKKRLELIGCRSINNVVDITNYILFTYGEPLHAFDLDKLALGFSGSRVLEAPHALELIIRRAKEKEEIVTIDGTRRILDNYVLIIAAGAQELKNLRTQELSIPIAIAGVMGGKDSEVTESTKNILLEAAVFNPVVVRRARQALGLQTDSSYRFERGIDFETCLGASRQAVKLIQELCGGKCVLEKSAGTAAPKKKKITLELNQVEKILGISVLPVKIKAILTHLGFAVTTQGKNKLNVTVPLFRQDASLPEDLIEEVARIHGFEKIPNTLPAVKPQLSVCATRDLVSLTKNILVGLGLNEVITYSLVDKNSWQGFPVEQNIRAVEILNPLSKEQEVLRFSLAPSLARCISYNFNQKQEHVNIFEIAARFVPVANPPKEELTLGLALSGTRSFLSEQGLTREEAGFLQAKGILAVLFDRLGIAAYDFIALDAFSVEISVNNIRAGSLTRLGKEALAGCDIKNREVFVAEVSLELLFSHVRLNRKFSAPPKYPEITRDISFILKEDASAQEILKSLRQEAGSLLRQVKIADYYKGKQIPAGFRGLTISCVYRSDERTLTEAEVSPLHAKLCQLLTERFGAKMR